MHMARNSSSTQSSHLKGPESLSHCCVSLIRVSEMDIKWARRGCVFVSSFNVTRTGTVKCLSVEPYTQQCSKQCSVKNSVKSNKNKK